MVIKLCQCYKIKGFNNNGNMTSTRCLHWGATDTLVQDNAL